MRTSSIEAWSKPGAIVTKTGLSQPFPAASSQTKGADRSHLRAAVAWAQPGAIVTRELGR